ncbi:Putative AC transposase [Dendrobium catenatum]|uniref:AC transposase n=1 Tax=Dendrobium catenatum TaxID=906689 RepID=A0A2I0XAF7_9ASPA|nr:Putative AC transposase [Dendrobium catenatum]
MECVRQSLLETSRGLRQYVPTRWNSTFIMLDSAIYFRRDFMHLELSYSNYKSCPSNSEWEKMVIICKFLAPFYEITCAFSGTMYPTVNLEYIRRMTVGMLAKFEKYWSDFSVILAIAVILDPWYKFNFFEWCYKRLYSGHYDSEITKVKDKLSSLYSSYSIVQDQPSTTIVSQSSQSSRHTPSSS